MSIKKRINSFRFALEGIRTLFQSEPNARIHLLAAIIVVISGFYFGLSAIEWVAIILAIGLVVVAEAFNTALEKLTDLASPEIHPLAKKAKDLAAAAVLISALIATVVGVVIFWKKIF